MFPRVPPSCKNRDLVNPIQQKPLRVPKMAMPKKLEIQCPTHRTALYPGGKSVRDCCRVFRSTDLPAFEQCLLTGTGFTGSRYESFRFTDQPYHHHISGTPDETLITGIEANGM